MKHIFTLFTALMLIAAAQSSTAQGGNKPYVSPNPAHDFIKVNWMQTQCDNIIITMYYANGTFAKTLANRQYCEGNYSQIFKVAGMIRGSYIMRIQLGGQSWSYKIYLQ